MHVWRIKYWFEVATPEGATTGLLTDSAIRCERLHTVPQADVVRSIGMLSAAQLRKVDDALKAALRLS